MVLERTRIASFDQVGENNFFINPEHLNGDEIDYELRIRSEYFLGSRRELTAKLRNLIKEEQRELRTSPKTAYSFPSEELTVCEAKLVQLAALLEQVSDDPQTHYKFMSNYLHGEGRLNRIPKGDGALNVSARVFDLNERFSECYHAFVQKLQSFKKGNRNRQDNEIEEAAGGIGNGSKGIESNGVFQQQEVQSKFPAVHSGTIPKQVIGILEQQEIEQNVTPAPMNDFQLLGNMLNVHQQEHRLSEHFGLHGNQITPIPPNASQTHFQFPSTNRGGNQHPLTSSRNNNDFERIPPEDFGLDRRNSMPSLYEQRRRAHLMNDGQVDNVHDQPNSPANPNRNGVPSNSDNGHGQATLRPDTAPFARNSRNESQLESAVVEIASAIGQMMNQMTAINSRLNEIDNRNRTYTVPNQRQVPITHNSPYRPQPEQFPSRGMNRNHTAEQLSNNVRRVPMHKWDLRFTANEKSDIPEEKDARAFLKRLEIFRDAEGVAYDEIFLKFHYLLKGHALTWFSQYRHEFRNWSDLKAGFLKQYTTPLTKFMTAAKLANRKQKVNETASDYIADIIRDFDSMEVFDEEERISIVQNGLVPELRNRAMSREWHSVQEMSIWLRKTEAADKLYGNVTQQPPVFRRFIPKRPTMAFTSNNIEDSQEVDESNQSVYGEMSDACEMNENVSHCNAISSQKGQTVDNKSTLSVQSHRFQGTKEAGSKKLLCFNCKSDQHRFIDCDRAVDRIFCFRCGKEEILAPQCECKLRFQRSKNLLAVACAETEPCGEPSPNQSN